MNYGLVDWGRNPIYTYKFYNSQKRSTITYKEDYSSLKSRQRSSLIFLDDIKLDISEFEKLKLPYSDYEKDKNALAFSVKYLRGQNNKSAVEFLIKSKLDKNLDLTNCKNLKKKAITSKHKLSKSMILDYLGNS